jgi:hypothetical protein
VSTARLFGVFATHSPESCPLNNKQNRDRMIEIDDMIKTVTEKFHVKRIIGFYLSVLEHQWVIIAEAESAHELESLCIEAGISAFNTIKIVPLNNFDVVMQRIRR